MKLFFRLSLFGTNCFITKALAMLYCRNHRLSHISSISCTTRTQRSGKFATGSYTCVCVHVYLLPLTPFFASPASALDIVAECDMTWANEIRKKNFEFHNSSWIEVVLGHESHELELEQAQGEYYDDYRDGVVDAYDNMYYDEEDDEGGDLLIDGSNQSSAYSDEGDGLWHGD
eukprot:m.110291 g.110291  ORF g.110291 m.110291 type:complete len:173 (+) comp12743_c1_seq8:1845-2363(+)